jgi:hypothetical protein
MQEWIDGVFGTVRCANCGAVYGRDSIALVGNRDEYWFVRCSCQACGTEGLGVVIVRAAAERPPETPLAVPRDPRADLIRVDDVLEAHELLRDYAGDVHGLFEKVTGR